MNEKPIPTEGLTTWEPNWVGAVIEDGDGVQWVKVHRGGGPASWHVVDWKWDGDPWAVWSAIKGPTYLHSPGSNCA